MKKDIVVGGLFVLLIIFIVVTYAYLFSDFRNFFSGPEKNGSSEEDKLSGEMLSINPLSDSRESGSSQAGSGSVAGGSSGGGSGGGSVGGTPGNESKEKELPSDLYTKECGFYFAEYDVCAGTCPSGQCLSEGRSCYCH